MLLENHSSTAAAGSGTSAATIATAMMATLPIKLDRRRQAAILPTWTPQRSEPPVNGQIQYDPPSAVTPVPTAAIVAGRDACHFLAPVRCGRRRTDQFGHLELTTERLRFHG